MLPPYDQTGSEKIRRGGAAQKHQPPPLSSLHPVSPDREDHL